SGRPSLAARVRGPKRSPTSRSTIASSSWIPARRLGSMRILFVALDPPLPTTNGHRIRTAAVLRALVADGHDVTLVSFYDPRDSVDVEGLNHLCPSVGLASTATQ